MQSEQVVQDISSTPNQHTSTRQQNADPQMLLRTFIIHALHLSCFQFLCSSCVAFVHMLPQTQHQHPGHKYCCSTQTKLDSNRVIGYARVAIERNRCQFSHGWQSINSHTYTVIALAAGRGWGNDDFLSSLGGSDDDRMDEKEKYEEFQQSREAFEERQRERMATPAGQKFMQDQIKAEERQREEMMKRNQDMDTDGGFFEQFGMSDEDGVVGREGSGRFANMMSQASKRMQGGMRGMGAYGFEQKFAIPLDDEDETEGNE